MSVHLSIKTVNMDDEVLFVAGMSLLLSMLLRVW